MVMIVKSNLIIDKLLATIRVYPTIEI